MTSLPARPDFLDALRALAGALEDLAIPAMVIGGVAVIARGVPRSTVDIDATILADTLDLDRLAATCAARRIDPRIGDAVAFARSHQVYLAVHVPSGVPVDISLAWLPFEREALERSTTLVYGDLHLRVPTPDDLLVYKIVASRPRDLDDAEQLLVLYGRTIDLTRVRGIISMLASALDDPVRLATFDALVARTMAQ